MTELKQMYEVSRRAYVQRRTPIETEISALIDKIESMGAHEKLTDAVVHLQDAFNAMADWHDDGRPGAAVLVMDGE